jgi:hypothetical protein
MSPGALEQGNARIGRPNLKSKETRPFTYYDWILAANSIDVTKVAYLMTKKVRIAAVEEATNPIFAGMDVPELFSLSLDNITENNSRESLAPYLGQNGMYRDFLEREKADFENFRVSNAHLLDANGKLKMIELQRAKDLEGSTIMRRIPYVPGLNIYGENELGLVRLDQFTKVEVKEEDEDADDGGGDDAEGDDDLSAAPEGEADDIEGDDDEALISSEDAAKTQARQAKQDFMEKVKDVTVHIDMGEGSVQNVSLNRGRVRIKLNSGESVYRSILSTFVITKPQTSMGDVRGSIAKMTGSIPIDTPWEVKPKEKVKVPPKKLIEDQTKKQHVDESKELELHLVVTNDMIGLKFSNMDDTNVVKTLRALKFIDTPAHYTAEFKSWMGMNRYFKAMLAKGYAIPKTQLALVSQFYYDWKSKGDKAEFLFGLGSSTQQKNFYTLAHKAVPDKKMCMPYISCELHKVFLCLPTLGHPGNLSVVKKVTASNVRVRPATPALMRFFNTPSDAAAFIRTLLKTGYTLTNHNELHAEFTVLRKEIPRATKKTMEQFYDEKEPTK